MLGARGPLPAQRRPGPAISARATDACCLWGPAPPAAARAAAPMLNVLRVAFRGAWARTGPSGGRRSNTGACQPWAKGRGRGWEAWRSASGGRVHRGRTPPAAAADGRARARARFACARRCAARAAAARRQLPWARAGRGGAGARRGGPRCARPPHPHGTCALARLASLARRAVNAASNAPQRPAPLPPGQGLYTR